MDKRSAVISALFEKKNKRKPKNSQELQDFVKSQGGDEFLKKVDEYIDQAEKELTKQAQKAEHGTKLQYLKSLKNKCNEDEELVYYKKGGSVNCGCKKKEEGGEVKKDCGGSAIAKFKKMKSGKKITIKQQPLVNPNDTVHVNGIAYSVTNSDGSPVDKRFKPYSGKVEEEDRKKAKKGDKDALKRQLKQDLASSEKCGGKVKKHQEGSVIDKFKAYHLGGSLNGIPFMQNGTPKKGVLYKPDWYKSILALHAMFDKNGDYYEMKTKRSLNGDTFTRTINTSYSLNPVVSDTTYRYFPVKGDPEIESTKWIYDHNKKNYERLREMFNKIASIPVKGSPIDLF